MNPDDRADMNLARAMRLLALALNRLATEMERRIREQPFKPVKMASD